MGDGGTRTRDLVPKGPDPSDVRLIVVEVERLEAFDLVDLQLEPPQPNVRVAQNRSDPGGQALRPDELQRNLEWNKPWLGAVTRVNQRGI